jgi:protein CpxP
MDAQNRPQHPTLDDTSRRIKRRSFFKGALAGGVVGTLLAVGVTVQAHNGGFQRMHMMGAMGDPAAMAERIEFGAEFMLAKVGATDEQKAEVRTILRSAVTDLAPLQQQHRSNRKAMRDALVAPTIDKTALTQLRTAEIKLADQASARIQQAVVDAAEVLTPAQRKTLLDRMEERRQRHRT